MLYGWFGVGESAPGTHHYGTWLALINRLLLLSNAIQSVSMTTAHINSHTLRVAKHTLFHLMSFFSSPSPALNPSPHLISFLYLAWIGPISFYSLVSRLLLRQREFIFAAVEIAFSCRAVIAFGRWSRCQSGVGQHRFTLSKYWCWCAVR